jgi:hypothetical protein
VSDQRKAASVGGSRERERHATLSVFCASGKMGDVLDRAHG